MKRRTRISLIVAGGVLLAAAATAGALSVQGHGGFITGLDRNHARAAAVAAVPGSQGGEVLDLRDQGPAAWDVAVLKPDGTTATVRLDKDDKVLGVRPGGPDTEDGDDD